MDVLISALDWFSTNIIPFFILLGILIFVHELGHFLTAKFFGVRVETFSIGFGKKIFQKTKGDTTYALSIIPLGGYVKMFGDDPTKEIPDEEKKYSFLHQPVWPRIWIVAAGPLVNFFFAILVFAIVAMVGENLPGTKLGDISPETAAYSAGFRDGDEVIKVTDVNVSDWTQVQSIIEANANNEISFVVKNNNEEREVKVTPELKQNPNIISFDDYVGQIEGLTINAQATLAGLSQPESPLGKAGLTPLSLIHSVNGKKVEFWRDLSVEFQNAVNESKTNGSRIAISFTDYLNEKAKPQDVVLNIDNLKIEANQKNLLEFLGLESPETYLMGVKEGSPAFTAGLRSGDKILKVNDGVISHWKDVLTTVKSFKEEDKIVSFEILRKGQLKTFSVSPEMTELLNAQGQTEKRFTVGIMPAYAQIAGASVFSRTLNPFSALWQGTLRSIRWTGLTLISFKKLFLNKVSLKNVSGVITIGRVASQSFEMGASAFLKVMAIISLNLFLLNLLPIPVLDGGHLVFFTIEACKGAPISLKKMEIAQTVGMVLLMSLMLFALFNDVNNWYSGLGW